MATAALVVAGVFCGGTVARAAPSSGQVSFAAPSLFPSFSPEIQDYVVRCHDQSLTVDGHASGGWEAAIGDQPFRSGDFSEFVPLSTGRAFVVTVREVGQPQRYFYHVRCIPDDFPTYTFTRYGPVSPKYFSVENGSLGGRFGMIFNDHGVPVWWRRARLQDPSVLSNGNILWANVTSDQYEIHRPEGTLVRTLGAVGQSANDHDLQVLDNGQHLAGAYVTQSHVDTSAYGGSSDANVVNTELQQVNREGGLVWRWRSQDHISLSETPPHRWQWAVNNPTPQGYDILHWNSIEPAVGSVIASFRHLDAVYKIRKATGKVAWKLGGTQTPSSLTVRGDPRHRYTFGAQHDARLLPDGTLTVFDNRTNVTPSRPRAVRFRINEQQRTATLLESITDPAVPKSDCCGSARRLPNGNWLIDWGKTGKAGPIIGYKPNGQRTFRLAFDSRWSYRAEPVPPGTISAQSLRQAMNAMCSSGCD